MPEQQLRVQSEMQRTSVLCDIDPDSVARESYFLFIYFCARGGIIDKWQFHTSTEVETESKDVHLITKSCLGGRMHSFIDFVVVMLLYFCFTFL